jgi:hypothetical protein
MGFTDIIKTDKTMSAFDIRRRISQMSGTDILDAVRLSPAMFTFDQGLIREFGDPFVQTLGFKGAHMF